MSISDDEFKSWLGDQNRRKVVLINFDYIDPDLGVQTAYASNSSYTTRTDDTLPNIAYDDIVVGNIPYKRSISPNFDGVSNISKGEIVLILNQDNQNLVNASFNQTKIEIRIGDASWAYADFRIMMKGRAKNKRVEGQNFILSFRDEMDGLNIPFDSLQITSGVNSGKKYPLLYGSCFNITPVLLDDSLDVYAVNSNRPTTVTQVRDNGVPVSFTNAYDGVGTFRLSSSPAGEITCDAYENLEDIAPGDFDASYGNTVAYVVLRLLSQNHFSGAIAYDYDSFQKLNDDNPEQVGYYIREPDSANVLGVIEAVLSSIGGFILIQRTGIMYAGQILGYQGEDPQGDIVESEIEEKGVTIKQFLPPIASITLLCKKNWTVQTNVASSVSPTNRQLFANEYTNVYEYYEDAPPYTNPSLPLVTYFDDASEAAGEALRRKPLLDHERIVYEIKTFANSHYFDVGKYIYVDYIDANVGSGVAGQYVYIIGITENLNTGASILEVIS